MNAQYKKFRGDFGEVQSDYIDPNAPFMNYLSNPDALNQTAAPLVEEKVASETTPISVQTSTTLPVANQVTVSNEIQPVAKTVVENPLTPESKLEMALRVAKEKKWYLIGALGMIAVGVTLNTKTVGGVVKKHTKKLFKKGKR